ncbi:hypothetical protein AUC47_14455 [Microbacterium sp. SZ1]|uniref:apiosidase-like domain-containing protein n=1 Tax=Microbacterium sp. SZ1 TaxID=1849736 RepID=UPI000BBBB64D|nr:DUF4038 domain-containing protein [Microbacterium sp. SZ1]PCE15292.1 hypothetical protein AUC47_14455 [Microbacterium sp. SZ1]
MPTWSLAPSRRSLLRDGAPAFLLADTTWAAFSGPTDEEWTDYLVRRRRQGFTGLLISVLPIEHDRSEGGLSPYVVRDGRLDLDGGDAEYWPRAERMLEEAVEHGFTPMLVLLWNNFVPATWGAGLTPELVLDEQQTLSHVRATVERFARFDPIWIVSGDDDLDSEVALARYSLAAAEVRRLARDALVTWHSTPTARMPEAIADGELLDLHGLQPGHNQDWDTLPRDLVRHYAAFSVPRPIVNLEPCYEGLGRFAGRARHSRADVRRASWTGVVAGAAAGLGYGAHGVWSWHRRGTGFTAENVHGMPFPFSVAMEFPGADDVGFLRRVVEGEVLFDLDEAADLLMAEPSGAVVGRTGDRVAVYAPEAFALTLRLDPADIVDVRVYDLDARRIDAAQWSPVEHDGAPGIRLEQTEFAGDALFVIDLGAETP